MDDAIGQELDETRGHFSFGATLAAIKERFTDGANFDATREGLRNWLLRQFQSPADSRASCGQAIDVRARREQGRLVDRHDLHKRFDDWLAEWPEKRSGLAVLGDEGDGKTWALASWLLGRFDADSMGSPVLWLPSPATTARDLSMLVGGHLANCLRRGSADSWLRRLQKWAGGQRAKDGPALILVLDGLNERHDPSWWRPILEACGSDDWSGTIAPIVTTRATFWARLSRLPHVHWTTCDVAPYNERELEQALSQVDLRPVDFSADVQVLLRKPRYFDLAIRLSANLAGPNEVSVARLIYEDWKDRESRRRDLPNEGQFQQLLIDLARKYRAGLRDLDRRALHHSMEMLESTENILVELETGGVLAKKGESWRVDESRLALALGLLLAESLRDGGQDSPSEADIDAVLGEPHDADLKATILEHATLHALLAQESTLAMRSALVSAWLVHRNQPNIASVVEAYCALDPQAFLHAAERIWASDNHDGVSEQFLKSAYSKTVARGVGRPIFAATFGTWLGLVHVDGHPRGIDAENRWKRRAELSQAVGHELIAGEQLEYAGLSFTAIADDELLRLRRLALAVISEDDRTAYAEALVRAFVADALMQWPETLDLCRWIIRTSPVDLWPALREHALKLVRLESRESRSAAFRLLGSVGNREALAIRDTLPADELFPKPDWLVAAEADPCVTGYSWKMEDCARCAARDDVPAHFMAQQLSKCAINPDLTIPVHTTNRIAALLDEISPDKLWTHRSTTEHDYALESIEDALWRSAQSAIAGTIRAIAREVQSRSGIGRRLLGHQLLEYGLALRHEERAIIRSTWTGLLGRGGEDVERERAEWVLFELFASSLPVTDQLEALLQRGEDALLLIRFSDQFKPISWTVVSDYLKRESDPRRITAILFFATANRIEDALPDQIEHLFRSADTGVRSLAMKLAYEAEMEVLGRALANSDWHAAR